MPMKYQGSKINKKNRNINFSLIYSFLFISIISLAGYYYLNIKNINYDLKNNKIPALEKRIITIENSLAVETKNNKYIKRNFIKEKAENLGMIKAEHSNIIDIWWNNK